MQGMSLSDIKKNPALIPLYGVVFAGVLMATFYTIRLAVANPDVSWNNKKNPEPWQAYKDKQYKFYSPNKLEPKSHVPEY